MDIPLTLSQKLDFIWKHARSTIKRSVTLSLALQFSAVLVFSLFSLGSQAVSVSRDKGIVRIQDRVFFVSDFNELHTNIKSFKCLRRKSLILSVVNLENSLELKKKLAFKDASLLANQVWIEKSIKLIKLMRYASRQPVSIPKSFIPKNRLESCRVNVTKLSPFLRKLIRAEVYLGDRFKSLNASKKIKDNSLESVKGFSQTILSRTKHKLLFGHADL